jgi:hypothetical protein
MDDRAYGRLMRNRDAQQNAWCGMWVGRLLDAGAQKE